MTRPPNHPSGVSNKKKSISDSHKKETTTESAFDNILSRVIENAGRFARNETCTGIAVWIVNGTDGKDGTAFESVKTLWFFDDAERPSKSVLRESMPSARDRYILLVARDLEDGLSKHSWPETSERDVVWKGWVGPPGVGITGGVSFHVNGHKGIVVYTYSDTCDLKELQSIRNEMSLLSTADIIGSLVAAKIRCQDDIIDMTGNTENSFQNEKPNETPNETERRSELFDDSIEINMNDAPNRHDDSNLCETITEKVITNLHKSYVGDGVLPPPPASFCQALLIFSGCFISMSIVGIISQALSSTTTEAQSLRMAPLGALVSILFSLTASQPAQPTNAFFAQVLGCTLAKLMGHMDAVPVWVCNATAVSATCALTAMLGLTHPPAAASAVIFSSGMLLPWSDVVLILFGNAVIILVAVLLNNLSRGRHYPAYWGFSYMKHRNHNK